MVFDASAADAARVAILRLTKAVHWPALLCQSKSAMRTTEYAPWRNPFVTTIVYFRLAVVRRWWGRRMGWNGDEGERAAEGLKLLKLEFRVPRVPCSCSGWA